MRFLRPVYLVVIGFALIATGFLYDILFAGIPYQDPAHEMEAAWRMHGAIAGRVILAGILLVVFGGLLAAFRRLLWARKGR